MNIFFKQNTLKKYCKIKGANKALQTLKLIRKLFNNHEIIQLLTSNFYNIMVYLPTLKQNLKQILSYASATALNICFNSFDRSLLYFELHE
jgi:hypothetical protein